MIFSPIFHVELLTVGRRRRYFVARVIYALILLAVMGYCYLQTFSNYRIPTLNDQAQFAFAFFACFSWIQLIAVLGLTPAMIAGTISVEHERKTIDYLLTTQLTDTEIALGKFAARVWSVIMQLAVGVPILAIGLMLGGVGPKQLIESFCVTLVMLVFTATLSLAISSRAAKSREAITRAYLVIIGVLVVPPVFWGICEMLATATTTWPNVAWAASKLIDPLKWLVAIHPFVQITSVLGSHTGLINVDLTKFAISYLGASAVMALSAVIGVRRFYVKMAGRSEAAASFLGRLKTRLRGRRRPVGERAMIWKEVTSLRSAIDLGWSGRIGALLLYCVALFFIVMGCYWSIDFYNRQTYDRGSPMEWTAMIEVPMIFGLMLLLITSSAAGSITGERERDTWITLISTPLEGGEIVRAKLLAVLYGVRHWYAAILLCWGFTAMFRPAMLIAVPFIMAMHFLAAMFAACVGMRCSLQASTSLKAMGTALAIMVLGVSIGPLIFTMFIAMAGSSGEPGAFFISGSLPALFSSIHPIFFAMAQDGRLDRGFGTYAAGCMVFTIIYAGATAVLYQQLVTAFDQYAGRSSRENRFREPTRTTGHMPLLAQGVRPAATDARTSCGDRPTKVEPNVGIAGREDVDPRNSAER